MSERRLAKIECYFTKRYSTQALSTSLGEYSYQLNFDQNYFLCASVFVGFIYSLPQRGMILSENSGSILSSFLGSSHGYGVGYQRFPSASVCLWNNWLRMCSHSCGWLFISSTCACAIRFVLAARYGFITFKLAMLQNCRVCKYGCGSLSLVSSFSPLTRWLVLAKPGVLLSG